jgi:hypothetical protein
MATYNEREGGSKYLVVKKPIDVEDFRMKNPLNLKTNAAAILLNS